MARPLIVPDLVAVAAAAAHELAGEAVVSGSTVPGPCLNLKVESNESN